MAIVAAGYTLPAAVAPPAGVDWKLKAAEDGYADKRLIPIVYNTMPNGSRAGNQLGNNQNSIGNRFLGYRLFGAYFTAACPAPGPH